MRKVPQHLRQWMRLDKRDSLLDLGNFKTEGEWAEWVPEHYDDLAPR